MVVLEVNAHVGPRHKELGFSADSKMLGQDPELDHAAHRLTDFAGSDMAVELAIGLMARLLTG